MKCKLLFLLLQFIVAAVAAPPERAMAHYLDLPPNAQPWALAADAAGNLFIVTTIIEPSGRPQIRVLKTDPQGRTLARLDFGGSNKGVGYNDSIVGAAIDSTGNLVIAGSTTSTDFPRVSPLLTNAAPFAAFIVKIDSQLKTILFSTTLGGTKTGTWAGAMALDSSGNIYVTGTTYDTDFPVTLGAFQTDPPPVTTRYAYLTKISADGRTLMFSTYFGSSGAVCADHTISCAVTFGSAIALDASGNPVIAGSTGSNQLPVTPGAFGPNCGDCGSRATAGFLARFSADGSKLLWATYVPVVSAAPYNAGVAIVSMAIDGAGDIVFGGSTTVGLPVTAGALQTVFPVPRSPGIAGFLMKIAPTAQRLLFSTYFGGEDMLVAVHPVAAVVTDVQGTIWVTGGSVRDELPVSKDTPILGESFLAGLSPDGSKLIDIFTAPSGAAGRAIALTSGGGVTALGAAGALLTASLGQGPSLVGVGNAASLGVSNAVAPYELISLYGLSLGPPAPAGAQVVDGAIAKSLSGVQVLFDGTPAPLLFVGPAQINAFVPSTVYGQDTTTLRIITPSGTLQGPAMLVRPAQPGVFLAPVVGNLGFAPFAIALNQDGSVNSSAQPAALGSIVTVWAGGTGISTYPQPDGTILNFSRGVASLPVSMFSFPLVIALSLGGFAPGALSLDVLYAGDAPGMIAGISQINFRLPSQVQSLTNIGFALRIGEADSGAFTLHLKQ